MARNYDIFFPPPLQPSVAELQPTWHVTSRTAHEYPGGPSIFGEAYDTGLDVLGAGPVKMTSKTGMLGKGGAQRAIASGNRAIAAGQRLMKSRFAKARLLGARSVNVGQKAVAQGQKAAATAAAAKAKAVSQSQAAAAKQAQAVTAKTAAAGKMLAPQFMQSKVQTQAMKAPQKTPVSSKFSMLRKSSIVGADFTCPAGWALLMNPKTGTMMCHRFAAMGREVWMEATPAPPPKKTDIGPPPPYQGGGNKTTDGGNVDLGADDDFASSVSAALADAMVEVDAALEPALGVYDAAVSAAERATNAGNAATGTPQGQQAADAGVAAQAAADALEPIYAMFPSIPETWDFEVGWTKGPDFDKNFNAAKAALKPWIRDTPKATAKAIQAASAAEAMAPSSSGAGTFDPGTAGAGGGGGGADEGGGGGSGEAYEEEMDTEPQLSEDEAVQQFRAGQDPFEESDGWTRTPGATGSDAPMEVEEGGGSMDAEYQEGYESPYDEEAPAEEAVPGESGYRNEAAKLAAQASEGEGELEVVLGVSEANDIQYSRFQHQITDRPSDPIRSHGSAHRGAAYLQQESYPPHGASAGMEGGWERPTEVIEVFGEAYGSGLDALGSGWARRKGK
jgi:hypothetical protein